MRWLIALIALAVTIVSAAVYLHLKFNARSVTSALKVLMMLMRKSAPQGTTVHTALKRPQSVLKALIRPMKSNHPAPTAQLVGTVMRLE
jgi:hypothetical protein